MRDGGIAYVRNADCGVSKWVCGVLHHFAALFAFLRVFWKYFFQEIGKKRSKCGM
jgi:hypothetical protein